VSWWYTQVLSRSEGVVRQARWRGSIALALGALLLSATARSDEAHDPRDAQFFGTPEEDPRDEAFFGAQEEDPRDAEVFGDDDRDALFFGDDDDAILTGAPADHPVRPDEERDEGRLLSSDDIEARLGLAEDRLDLGGFLFLRMDYGARNQGNPETFPIGSPNLLDLYLDARPNDRLRAFVRGRATHSFLREREGLSPFGTTSEGGTHVALDQLWLKFDVEHRLYVTAGRQPIRWGAGRFWNPTDFLNQQRRDPLAVFDERLGVGLLKLHLPDEAHGWNFYALANLEDASRPDEIGGALRAEKLIGLTEVSLTVAARKDQPLQLGADAPFPVGLFDFRIETALLRGVQRDFFRGPVSLDPAAPRLPTSFSREDEWIPQVVVGAEIGIPYGDDDSLILGAEYFYNGMGVEDPTLYPWLLFTGDFTPLYLGRQYAGVYATAIGPGSWNDTTFIGSLLTNLTDGSFLTRFDWRVRLLTYLDFNAYAAFHFGKEGEFHFALRLPKVEVPEELAPQLPAGLGEALSQGVSVAPPLLDLGLGLTLRF
jgi:hypothetical protein